VPIRSPRHGGRSTNEDTRAVRRGYRVSGESCTYPDAGRAITRSRALPWNARRFRRAYRCSWCRRPATRAFKRPGDLPTYFNAACEECWRREHRHALPKVELTPADRRFRWAIRCSYGRPALYLSTTWRGLLEGRCRECWRADRTVAAWSRVFLKRQGLVRRNLPQGELRKSLLKWVSDTEQARGDRTWRQRPDPPRPPYGGTPACVRNATA
jgi:hypothetical protein